MPSAERTRIHPRGPRPPFSWRVAGVTSGHTATTRTVEAGGNGVPAVCGQLQGRGRNEPAATHTERRSLFAARGPWTGPGRR